MRRVVRHLAVWVSALSVLTASLVVSLIIVKRMRTGDWAMPNFDDVKAVRADLNRVKERVKEKVLNKPPEPSRVIYLNGEKTTLIAGTDDAPNNVSSVVLSGEKSKVVVPGWRGSKSGWKKVVGCVREQFASFDVVVTDVRPTSGDFMMAMVGGRVEDVGVKSKHVGGLAPFNGKVIPRAVVFAFARKLKHRWRTVCETLAMEIAHAYGLDHAYHCPDVMTYLRGCGKKSFRDRDVRCGEHKKRDCSGGGKTQNSVRQLLGTLGPARSR